MKALIRLLKAAPFYTMGAVIMAIFAGWRIGTGEWGWVIWDLFFAMFCVFVAHTKALDKEKEAEAHDSSNTS